MGVKKFIQSVLESLNMKSFELQSKKKSLKTLLAKLKKRRVKILSELEFETNQEKRITSYEEPPVPVKQVAGSILTKNNV